MQKEQLISTLRQNLLIAKEDRLHAKMNSQILAAKVAVKEFQVARLKKTHADFLTSPKTSQATGFFLRELYGSKDMTQRDKDLEKFIPLIEKTFPLNTLEVITQGIILDALTETLDTKMANQLGVDFDEEKYLTAFFEVTTIEERKKQLKIVQELGNSLCQIVHIPFLSTTIKIMSFPAKVAGLYSLHQFLENGFNTFKATQDAQHFVNTLVARENQIIDNIFNKKTKPFVL